MKHAAAMRSTELLKYDETKELMQNLCREKDWRGIVICFICLGNQELCHGEADDSLEERVERACDLLQIMDEKGCTEGMFCTEFSMVYRTMSGLFGQHTYSDDKGGTSSASLDTGSDFQLLSSARTELIQFINTILADELESKEKSADLADKISQALDSNGAISIPRDLIPSIKVHDFWDSVLQKCRMTSTMMDRDEPLDSITLPQAIPVHPSSTHLNSGVKKSTSFSVDPETAESIAYVADKASGHIYNAATLFQNGMKKVIVPNVNRGIEVFGEFVKQNTKSASNRIDAQEEDLETFLEKEKTEEGNLDEVIALTDASVGATDAIRVGARSTIFGLRDFSTRKINEASELWNEKEIGKQIIPDDSIREVAKAAGKVGIATLGASAIFVETMFDATSEVAKKSVTVASDVTTHTHGEEVGKVVRNTGIATGNILRTMTHVGAFEAGVVTKVVARNAAKVNMQETLNGSDESMFQPPHLKIEADTMADTQKRDTEAAKS